MAYVRTEKCDLCKGVQTSDDPGKIKGTFMAMNHVRKFICHECQIVFDKLFEVGTDQLRDKVLELCRLQDRVKWLETEKRGLEERLKHKVEESRKERGNLQTEFASQIKKLENEIQDLRSKDKPVKGGRRSS